MESKQNTIVTYELSGIKDKLVETFIKNKKKKSFPDLTLWVFQGDNLAVSYPQT